MGDKTKDAGKAWGSCRVEMRGVLAEQPEMVRLPPQARRFCQAMVHCTGSTYRVSVYDDNAELLRDTPAETRLLIVGKLVRHEWKTGQGKPRDRVVIRAESIEVL